MCPQGVWSDDEDCISILSSSIEQLVHPSNSLEQVLQLVSDLLLTPQTGDVAAEEEEGMDSEEEGAESDFDDYYNDDLDANADTEDKKEWVY